MEIVGVVEGLGTTSGYGPMGLYHPVELGDMYPAPVAVHVPAGAVEPADALRGEE